MSVDTKLFINPRWGAEDVGDVIKKRLKTTISYQSTTFPDYVRIHFELNGEKRGMNVHGRSELGGFPSVQLSMRSDDDSTGLMKLLAETFGGFFQEADGDSTFEEYQMPGQGDIRFVIDEALKDDPENIKNNDRLIDWIKNEKWKGQK